MNKWMMQLRDGFPRCHLFVNVNLIGKSQFVSASVLLKKEPDLSKNASFVAQPAMKKMQELHKLKGKCKGNPNLKWVFISSYFLLEMPYSSKINAFA
jgi:hypothetical protein